MNQTTELRKEIQFYQNVMECTDRKWVKNSARNKKEKLEKKLNEFLFKTKTDEV